jgi:hypothetical protein
MADLQRICVLILMTRQQSLQVLHLQLAQTSLELPVPRDILSHGLGLMSLRSLKYTGGTMHRQL